MAPALAGTLLAALALVTTGCHAANTFGPPTPTASDLSAVTRALADPRVIEPGRELDSHTADIATGRDLEQQIDGPRLESAVLVARRHVHALQNLGRGLVQQLHRAGDEFDRELYSQHDPHWIERGKCSTRPRNATTSNRCRRLWTVWA